jgi:hypothetical protein
VTTPTLDLNAPSTAKPSPERGWVIGDPAVREIVRAARVSVFRITGPLTPGECGARAVSEATGGVNQRGGPAQPGPSAPSKR